MLSKYYWVLRYFFIHVASFLPKLMYIVELMAERFELYRHIPPPEYPILVGYLPFLVDEAILEDEEISWAVRRLLLNRAGGLSGMRAEHLCQWLIAVMWDDLPDSANWKNVVTIVQEEFCDGTLAEECT